MTQQKKNNKIIAWRNGNFDQVCKSPHHMEKWLHVVDRLLDSKISIFFQRWCLSVLHYLKQDIYIYIYICMYVKIKYSPLRYTCTTTINNNIPMSYIYIHKYIYIDIYVWYIQILFCTHVLRHMGCPIWPCKLHSWSALVS